MIEESKKKIPQKIHYIWLGGQKKDKFLEACLLSWRLNHPNFEIIEWNEKNLDLEKISDECEFFAQCRKRKLWAFMADYLRIKILYENGGIYIDTDVQSIKPINDLLDNNLILGYEMGNNINTGLIGATKHNKVIKNVLDFYKNEIMNIKEYTIPTIMGIVMKRMKEEIKIFPRDYFSPYNYIGNFSDDCITNNTYCIHWYEGNWTDSKQVNLFLQTKHIKNPFIKNIVKVKKIIGYYKRKIIK